MPAIRVRFYEELGDFLPPERRKRDFYYNIGARETVKHAIEACGVPHTEVELILANGISVGFNYLLSADERISVYPQFEAFDISPLLKVRDQPLRNPRFVADVHLGGLSRYLRMLGFDTLYDESYQDTQIAAVGARERRIVLTRDRDLLMHRVITHGRYVRATRLREQVCEVVDTLDLSGWFAPFTRCLECNTLLAPVEKTRVQHRLTPGTMEVYRQFSQCCTCARVYWRGSHYRRMLKFMAETLGYDGARHRTH